MDGRIFLMVMVAAVAPIGWRGAEAWRQKTDEAAVRAVVEKYFEGMMTGSPETLAEAFDPEAFLIGRGRGAPVRISFEEWAPGMDEPFEDPERYVNRIAWVDVTGDAAMARTVLEWPEVRYVDYLSLLKIDGKWRIVNKIWNQETPAAILARIDVVPIDAVALERYAGTYRVGERVLEVWVEGDRLGLAQAGGSPSFLYHVGEETFAPAFDPDGRLEFKEAEDRVTGFELRYGDREVVTERVE
ncbi:MAG: nuclear transport factor 2 family protein [Gemmatimonadetes bacterium]|nr:nuclear transport factor 2 family protein [Gemmatimonadota bacterium]